MEYNEYLAQIQKVLIEVIDVPLAHRRFLVNVVRGCHCGFCLHRWFCYRLQDVDDWLMKNMTQNNNKQQALDTINEESVKFIIKDDNKLEK